jgi:phage FluMu protein Com
MRVEGNVRVIDRLNIKYLLKILRGDAFTKCPRCGYQSPIASKEEQINAEHKAQKEKA